MACLDEKRSPLIFPNCSHDLLKAAALRYRDRLTRQLFGKTERSPKSKVNPSKVFGDEGCDRSIFAYPAIMRTAESSTRFPIKF
jgi:hypothetical protein